MVLKIFYVQREEKKEDLKKIKKCNEPAHADSYSIVSQSASGRNNSDNGRFFSTVSPQQGEHGAPYKI